MRVKLLDRLKQEVEAEIVEGSSVRLPTFHDGWRFNFNKHSKVPETLTYALVTKNSPHIVEGCLIYRMLNKNEPYMAYLEVAPHNKGTEKMYDRVAGSLIAYACRLSFIQGQGIYKGWLLFDVQEEDKRDEEKLMKVYSSKYKAKRIDKTTAMCISPKDGEALINEYLN